jgi:formate dehydrogenase subunit gamma
MNGSMRSLLLGVAAVFALTGLAGAQPAAAVDTAAPPATAAAPNGPPAGFVAPAEPKADENNAARFKSQPGNNAPMWRAVRETGTQAGVIALPGAEKGVLVQPFVQYPGTRYTSAGEAWRQIRNQWIIPYGGSLLIIAVLTLALVYWRVGSFGHPSPNTGRVIERFTPFERAIHWSTAISFAVLAVSGIVMAFGKFFMLPVLGSTLFGWLGWLLKTGHNFAGPLFAVSLVLFSLTYLRDNLPRAGDMGWLLKGGGMLSGNHVPSHRYNAGEKIVFWGGGIVLGLTVVASGLVLDYIVPGWGDTRGQMQVAHIVHAIASILMMALFFGHIYMGVWGVPGAMQAMKTGYVDEAWAKEHHEQWYDDVKAGKIPAQRSQTPPPPVLGSVSSQA